MTQQKLTTIEAAKILGVSVSFIRKQVNIGALPHFKLGARYFFYEQDVLNLIKQVGQTTPIHDTELNLE